MSLTRWFRKNNKKVMAVVVIVIMFGFVGGTYLSSLARRGPRPSDVMAYFLDGHKITRLDLQLAHQQLQILAQLGVKSILLAQDMQGIVLAELLFAEQSGGAARQDIVNLMKRTIATNQYRISGSQIAAIYQRTVPVTIYWHLLKNEAHQAGVRVALEEAGRLLGNTIPQLFPGATYKQVIGSMVKRGFSEKQVLTAFAELVAVLQYGHLICSNENLTTRQMVQTALDENESLDTEFVKVAAEVFAKTAPEPNEAAIEEHFNKYKAFPPATVTKDNPHGFGYKLPDRVRLEYMAVKLDDVETIVKQPTQQELQDYYLHHKEQFSEQVPSDPNDPNSEYISRTRRFVDVAETIKQQLLSEKIDSRARGILSQAKTMCEPNLVGTTLDIDKLTPEQYRRKAGDYKTIAEKLSEEHNLPIYTGKTGLLSAVEMQMDRTLGRLALPGAYYPVNLTQVVFAVDEIGTGELGPFDVPKPRMYETVGPAQDPYAASRRWLAETSGQILLLARVVEAHKSAEPNSLDESYETHTLVLDPNDTPDANDVYSVRQKVVEDLKRLAALASAEDKAEELVALAKKNGWSEAVDEFNRLYGQQAKDDPNDPNVFVLDSLRSLSRTPAMRLETLAVQNQGNPAAAFFLNQARIERQFTDQLFGLVPPDSNTPAELPVIMEFKPGMSFYCIKDLRVKRFYAEDFERIKISRIAREDRVCLESLAPIHYNPRNILTRMRFKVAGTDEGSDDGNTPAEAEADP